MDDGVLHRKNGQRSPRIDVGTTFCGFIGGRVGAAGLVCTGHFTVEGRQLDVWVRVKSFGSGKGAESAVRDDGGSPAGGRREYGVSGT